MATKQASSSGAGAAERLPQVAGLTVLLTILIYSGRVAFLQAERSPQTKIIVSKLFESILPLQSMRGLRINEQDGNEMVRSFMIFLPVFGKGDAAK